MKRRRIPKGVREDIDDTGLELVEIDPQYGEVLPN
jgi:hypothetical protein